MKKKTFKSTKKTIIALGLAAVFTMLSVASPFAGTVSFAESMELVENDFHYTIIERTSGKTVRIDYYSGPEEKLSIPETLGGMPVTEIIFDGSQNRDKITEISLPKTLTATEFLYISLRNLNNLSSITVANDNPELASKDGVLFTKDFSVLAVYPRAKTDASYTEPDTVKKSYGFENNRFLKEITFSSNKEYTSVGPCSASSIEKVNIPSNIMEIGESAFENCTSLKEIHWENNVKTIGMRAFAGCTALTDATLSQVAWLTRIEDYAFTGCTGLKTINLPKGLTYIGNGAFSGTSLNGSITIPDSVLKIGYNAFYNCKVKIKKQPYLKKITHKYESLGDVSYSYTYSAKAAVTKKGKIKNYAAKDITKIKAEKKTVKVNKGKKTTLNTIVYIKRKKNGTLDSSILSYRSSNKAIAKVTEKGVVKGIKKGTAKVCVKLRTTGKSYYVKIMVK